MYVSFEIRPVVEQDYKTLAVKSILVFIVISDYKHRSNKEMGIY
jgi:hypothetical protein